MTKFCRRGHPMTEANTYLSKDGWAMCRACRAARMRESRRRLYDVHGEGWPVRPDTALVDANRRFVSALYRYGRRHDAALVRAIEAGGVFRGDVR